VPAGWLPHLTEFRRPNFRCKRLFTNLANCSCRLRHSPDYPPFLLHLTAIFFKPLLAVMAERDARTVGAQKASEAAQAAAAEKVKQYQEASGRRGAGICRAGGRSQETARRACRTGQRSAYEGCGESARRKRAWRQSLPLLAGTSKPLSRNFPPRLRAASCKLRRVLALPREKLDDTKIVSFSWL